MVSDKLLSSVRRIALVLSEKAFSVMFHKSFAARTITEWNSLTEWLHHLIGFGMPSFRSQRTSCLQACPWYLQSAIRATAVCNIHHAGVWQILSSRSIGVRAMGARGLQPPSLSQAKPLFFGQTLNFDRSQKMGKIFIKRKHWINSLEGLERHEVPEICQYWLERCKAIL